MDADALLRRVERTAAAVCLAMAAVALVIGRGRPGPALGVIAGGVLIGVSYWAINSGVSDVVHAAAGAARVAAVDAGARVDTSPASADPSRKPRRTALKLAGRYALLALLAYVMIARLRMHPLALLAGASSFVAAVSIEAVRLLVKKR